MTRAMFRAIRLLLLLVAACLLPNEQAAALSNPEPPAVEVVGEPGSPSACYWVFAESAEPLGGLPSHYIGNIRGKVTALSRPAQVNLPRNLGKGGKVVLRIRPVPGAVRYYILKTVALPKPQATEPVVYFKTNLFLRDALKEVTRDGFVVAF